MSKLPQFDELRKLSPDELEKVRLEFINEIIESSRDEDQKRKLQGLQFKIDMERRKAKNPLDACIRISNMMQDSFSKLRDSLNNIKDIKSPTLFTPKNEVSTLKTNDTNIVNFRRDKHD